MKPVAKFGLGCGGIILFFFTGIIIYGLIIYFNSSNWIAKSPERICKSVDLKLPPYEIIEEENNMNRDASSWSWYQWTVKTKKTLSENEIQKLEMLVKTDPNWKGSRYDSFEYKNYKNFGEPGYDMDYDTFISPQILINVSSTGYITISYTWQDYFF